MSEFSSKNDLVSSLLDQYRQNKKAFEQISKGTLGANIRGSDLSDLQLLLKQKKAEYLQASHNENSKLRRRASDQP